MLRGRFWNVPRLAAGARLYYDAPQSSRDSQA